MEKKLDSSSKSLELLENIHNPVLYIEFESGAITGNSAISHLLGFSLSELNARAVPNLLFDCITKAPLSIPAVQSQLQNKRDLICQIQNKFQEFEEVRLCTLALPAVMSEGVFLSVEPAGEETNGDCKKHIASPFLDEIFNNINDAIFLAPLSREGVHGNFVEVNQAACDRLGYSRDELLKMNARTINPNANQIKVKTFGRSIQREGDTYFEAVHVAKDGTEIPVSVTARVIRIYGTEYVLSVTSDLREQQALKHNDSRFARLVDHSWDEIYIFDSSTYQFIQVNQGALNNLGYSSKELLKLRLCDLEPEISEAEFAERTKILFDGNQSQIIYETRHKRKNGSFYPVEVRLQLSCNEVPPVFLANIQDITERKKSESRLQYLANYDSLTGLPNRSLFQDRLNMAMEHCQRNDTLIALLYLDLDGFKMVNDTRGHFVGDELLKQVSKRLEQGTRKSDTVARLGGDEFCILISNLKQTEYAYKVADNIVTSIGKPYLINDEELSVSTSVGICYFPFAEDDGYQLMQKADAAMYRAKALGKNNVQFFTDILDKGIKEKVNLEHDLDLAIRRNEFYLAYQPRIDLVKMQIVGVEALIRWQHPERGLIPPLEFIPTLEKSGKIVQVGTWVLQTATEQLAKWNRQGHNMKMSVNISARQLENRHFPSVVFDALYASGIRPSDLELEITEGTIIEMSELATASMRQISEKGVSFALDDFGTGYSSLSYLNRFVVDTLKIDRGFVSKLENSQYSEVIVDAIVKLGRSLGLNVIAEGIENEKQLAALRQFGCDEGQGFYFAKPLTVEELEDKLFVISRAAS